MRRRSPVGGRGWRASPNDAGLVRAARLAAVALGVVAALIGAACASGRRATPVSGTVAPVLVDTAAPPPDRNDPFLADLEERSFQYFWRTTDPRTGLTPDRSPSPSFASIAAIGFALTSYPVGASEGYIARPEAAARTLATLRFLWTVPQDSGERDAAGYKGFFYHFLDMRTGRRFGTVELSTIDTAILLAGALVCQEYFDGSSAQETAIRAYTDSLYRRVDWTWASPNPPAISLGWTPDSTFMPYDWRGYNESMLLYILALGSETHPVNPDSWQEYTRTYRWEPYFGAQYLAFGPLFGHEFSHVWIDFRGIQDAYMRDHQSDYFQNSRRALYAQRSYATLDPMGWEGYGPELWGFTASDGPRDTSFDINGTWRTFWSYWPRGAAYTRAADDGTIAPTALGGGIPFAPEITVPTLKAIRAKYGSLVYSSFGFFDAFNPSYTAGGRTAFGRVDGTRGWFDSDYLGIDEGPMVAMIENYRTELVWRMIRRSPYVIRGLRRAGFTGGWLDGAP
jgi:hypothetical protein